MFVRNGCEPWCRRHTRIEEDEAIGPDEVDTASTRLATQQEYEFLAVGVVELVDKFLSLIDCHCAV